MFFTFSFDKQHLKKIKQHQEAFYKLVSKLVTFSGFSFEKLITLGKEDGIAKVKGEKLHKKLNIDVVNTLYKFRVSDKIRCYCIKNVESEEEVVLELVFLDVNHKL